MATSMTICGVPGEVRNGLSAQARRSGRSLQAYLRMALTNLSQRPDPTELLSRIHKRKQGTGTWPVAEQILAHRDADRR